RCTTDARTFKWPAPSHRGITSDSDTDVPPVAFRLGLFEREILVINQFERPVKASGIVTAVVDHFGFVQIGESCVIGKIFGLEQVAPANLNRVQVQTLGRKIEN